MTSIHTPVVLWCWVGLWIASHSRLCINGASESGRLRDVCVCQWVKWLLHSTDELSCADWLKQDSNENGKVRQTASTHGKRLMMMELVVVVVIRWKWTSLSYLAYTYSSTVTWKPTDQTEYHCHLSQTSPHFFSCYTMLYWLETTVWLWQSVRGDDKVKM